MQKEVIQQIYENVQKDGFVDVDTEGSGICRIHSPESADNPTDKWVFTGEGADWAPREYESLEKLLQEENDIEEII